MARRIIGEPVLSGKAKLIDTARRLFIARGSANVGINEVLSEAGVARMTLYNNFPSKDDLIFTVYQGMADETLRGLNEISPDEESECDRVFAVFDYFEQGMKDGKFRGCPFVQASYQSPESLGRILSIVHSYKRNLRDRIFRVLDHTKPERSEIADQILLLLDGAVIESYIQGVPNPIASAKRASAALLASS